jgi:iron complex outermembrane receptor protein
MSAIRIVLLAGTVLAASPAFAQGALGGGEPEILVTAELQPAGLATKTDTPAIEVPQPVTVIPAEVFEAQGAVSISDTLNYAAGVQANAYGPDSRVDGALVRGINALQFRDGMRDVFSYYATIRADPYNFASVQLLRGPSSMLFGGGALGGIVNLNSKLPQFTAGGEVAVRYGSHDRKEALLDWTGPLAADVAGRLVARVRDAGTQTDFVPDDRVLLAPSLTYSPTLDTTITLLGVYQEDDSGSTSQFLPVVGTILPNPNGQLPSDLFVGKPGWDRYDGRLLQGTGLVEHRFADGIKVNLKARYIDSDLTYLTHYPDSYGTLANPMKPLAPYLDPEQRLIGLHSEGSYARMEVFSSDNNLQFDFATGAGIEHVLLAGVDYSWNHVRKRAGFGYEVIDIYDIDYGAINGWNGGLPQPETDSEDVEQQQLGFYLQDQIRLYDRVSLVLGARRDDVWASALAGPKQKWSATTFRAGLIGELIQGVSPFVSYTESFEPISGSASNGQPFVPKFGRQYEIGVKLQPNDASIVTLTAYHIKENNRPVDDPSTQNPFDQMQAGELVSKGFEFEARTELPGKLQLIANYSYNDAKLAGSDVQLDDVPKHNASLWATRPFILPGEKVLTLGAGVRHSGKHRSYGPAFPDGLLTPGYTLLDAYAELGWRNWSLALNATNLLGKDYYSACLARGDCFMGAERNVYATLGYRF